jgi:putative ABC transport system substrate-binding protein
VIDRRTAISGAAVALSIAALPAHSRLSGRRFRIGRLGTGKRELFADLLKAQDDGLRELGYVEGRNLTIDDRVAPTSDALPELAAELVRLPVDVIVAFTNIEIAAAQRATATIPIVMVVGVDPVRNGFIHSLARPGGNITGLTNDTGQQMQGKVLSLLKELVPGLARVALLVGAGVGFDRSALDDAIRRLGLAVVFDSPVSQPEDIAPAFAAMKRNGAQAYHALGSPHIWQHRQQVADLALAHRLPGIHFSKDYVRAGALASYGTVLTELSRRSAAHIAKILEGSKPAEMPVELPTRFELVINLKTAKALGLTVPQAMRVRADGLIE